MKKCTIRSCPGEYEEKRIAQVLKHHGEVIVLENVPVEVCNVCGDTLVPLRTSEAIHAVLKNPGKPTRTVPVNEVPETMPA